jgi:hypothetical protein
MAFNPMMNLATPLFVLGLTLAGAASAGPIDDRVGGKVGFETAYAPVPNAAVDADSADSASAILSSTDKEAAQAGNPLWMIPLRALTQTRERPLFSVSRRPPAAAVQATASTGPANDPAPGPAPPERPTLELIGTIVSQTTSIALLKDSATAAVKRLRPGEVTSGWRVKTVELRSVTLEKGAQSAILNLPEPRETSGEHPAASSHPPVGKRSQR